MITQTYPLSLQPGGIPVRVPCVQGDIQSRTLQFQLTSSGASANLPAGAGVTLEGTKPDGRSFSVAGTLSDDVAEITLTAQMTAVSGEIPCRLNITSGSKVLGTGQLLLEVAPSALPSNPDLSDSDISLLTQMKNTVNQFSAAKADKKTPSAAKNVALLDAGGNLMDSGKQLTPSGIGAMTDGAGLWGFTDLPSGADLNDYTACGFYKYSYDDTTFSIQNSPARAAFTMQVMNACGYGDHDAIGGKALKYRLQKLTTWQGDEYVRQAYTDSSGSVTYGAWKTVLNNGALGITSGSWTPTVSGAASYTIQTGRYIKIGDMAVVTFSVYGTFAGSTTGRIKVSGCPLTPGDSITAGGGDLSGYTAASNIVFTGWQCNTNGSFYAVGQETGTTGTSKLGSSAIYQKTSGEFLASGTIAFKAAS